MHALKPEILTAFDGEASLFILETDTPAEALAEAATRDAIGIRFPAFADGRGFSLARLLRDTHGYKGKICALGDFLPDQMHYLARCGFSAFALPEGTKEETAAQCLQAFTEAYQISCDRPEPLFRRL